ncbi:hypothetical protein C2G38_2174933 [Gigaspora rosea]|uniref:Uncharacterized protein n=1 Tax=Gigaspora rosea TaxID=44941 RepID=A0A397VSG2_9GLOM|nr:hypothetical protein C2G38_2174933 [Gigaspora rosea]
MSTFDNEKYLGYDALISYLISKKDKSYYGFLSRYRENIAVSTLSVPMKPMSQWQRLDDKWLSRFYEAAEEVEPDSISGLRVMIKSVHKAHNFEKYWIGIISECEKKHEINNYEATREQLLFDLSIIDNKIKMAKEELDQIFSTYNVQFRVGLISNQNPENNIYIFFNPSAQQLLERVWRSFINFNQTPASQPCLVPYTFLDHRQLEETIYSSGLLSRLAVCCQLWKPLPFLVSVALVDGLYVYDISCWIFPFLDAA